jgi:alpha/beta superfamily hydrolase
MKPQGVWLPCGGIRLEGMLFKPPSGAQLPAVAVCHPHPLYGGSMHNNVTFALAEALVKSGVAVLLFNFRGVGRSGGSYAGGIGEREDVAAALDWLAVAEGVDGQKMGMAGYSFGAGVSLPVGCTDTRVNAMALVSPYCEESPLNLLAVCRKPKLFVAGGRDGMVPAEDVKACYEGSAEPRAFELFPGADHFWGGHESSMAEAVARFFNQNL